MSKSEADATTQMADSAHPPAAAAAPAAASASVASSSSSSGRSKRGADVDASQLKDEETAAAASSAVHGDGHQPPSASKRRLTSGTSAPQMADDADQWMDGEDEETLPCRQLQDEGEDETPTPTRRFDLHRDAIQSMFDFLDRPEFVRLARCSKEFRQVAARIPSRRWTLQMVDTARLAGLLASPLRRHVISLVESTRGLYPRHLPVTPADLHAIADRMAHLEDLRCEIRLMANMPPPRWPPQLRRLALQPTLGDVRQPKEDIARLMTRTGESLRDQAPLVDGFTVGHANRDPLDFLLSGELLSPLLGWAHLKRLTLRGAIAPSAYAIVRRMEHLTYLELNETRQFVELMSPAGPVPPRLEEIRLRSGCILVDSASVPLLLKLPSLRTLHVCLDLTDPTPLVPILRHLRSLEVVRGSSCELDAFIVALQQATQLTELDLYDFHLTESHLASVLAAMPHLRKLDANLPAVKSLHFLADSSVAHLAQTLKELRLCNCHLDPIQVAAHLRPLRALETLALECCFTSNLNSATICALTPGADGFKRETWPHLRTFEWTMPESDCDSDSYYV